MWKDRIALQLYSVREDLKADFYGTLKNVKDMGYTAVEFAGLYGNDPKDVRKMCEELGLIPLSAHVPYLELRDNLENAMDCYATLGCKFVVIPYLNEELRPGNDAFFSVLEAIPAISKAANAHGLILQYHNHDFEFVKLDGEYALDAMYRIVDAALLQTQLDTCWVKVAGEDPVAYLKKYTGRIPTVHLKDFAGSKAENMYELIGLDGNKKQIAEEKFEFRPLGKGRQDFPAILRAALESGADWFIVEQDRPSMGYTALECAAISAKYLQEIEI